MKIIGVTDTQYEELGSRTTGFGQKPQDVIEALLRQSPKLEPVKAVVEGASYLNEADHKKLKSLVRRLVNASIALDQKGSADPDQLNLIFDEHQIAYNRLHGFLRSLKG